MAKVRCRKLVGVAVGLLIAAAFVAALPAQPASTQPADAAEARYLQKLFEDVTIDRDILYKTTTDHTGQSIELRLDVYRPKSDTQTSRPAIIWVHGGGLSHGDKDMPGSLETDFCEAFARRGYVTLSVDYRLRPDPEPVFNDAMRDAMSDVQSALGWLRAHAAEFGVDPDRIALAGYSAGGEIVTNLCYTPFVESMDPRQVAAVVDIAGNTLFFGEPAGEAPPCLIVHGTADTINPFSASQDLQSKLAKNDVPCELFAVTDADHFFNRDPANVLAIEQAITEFLRSQLATATGVPDAR